MTTTSDDGANFIQGLFFFFKKILGCPRLAGMEKELGAAETESLAEEEAHIDSSELHGWENSCDDYIFAAFELFYTIRSNLPSSNSSSSVRRTGPAAISPSEIILGTEQVVVRVLGERVGIKIGGAENI